MASSAASVTYSNPWLSWHYITANFGHILAAVRQHVALTLIAVAIGFAISLPIALAARRWRWVATPALAVAGVAYAIPSLALFVALIPFTGLSRTTVEIGLVLYTLLILLRNTLTGLGGVPREVREAAQGLGYGPIRLTLTVDLPLAIPAIIAGLRVATVSTIALTTIGAIVGYGGLGNDILQGFQNNYRAQATTATLACILLAVVADAAWLLVQRLLTPWARR